jgi:hypothetical protein
MQKQGGPRQRRIGARRRRPCRYQLSFSRKRATCPRRLERRSTIG